MQSKGSLESLSGAAERPGTRARMGAGFRHAIMQARLLCVMAVLIFATCQTQAAVYTWSTTSAPTSWLSAADWNSGTWAGLTDRNKSTDGAATDIANFSSTAGTGIIDISMANNGSGAGGGLTLGAIDLLSSANKDITIAAISAAGTLTLTGGTVNATANTILANEGTKNLTISNAISLAVILGNTTDNVIQVNGTGNITINTVIQTGSGSKLTIGGAGSGSVVLSGLLSNTYTGATTIKTGGTLKAAGAAGSQALGATSGLVVNNGGTLLLGASNQINNSAAVTLGSVSGSGVATFKTGGFSEGSFDGTGNGVAGVGALTLSANSVVDMGSGSSVLAFADSHLSSWTGTLSVYNWSGNPGYGGGSDRLFFGNTSTGLTSSQLGEIVFYSGAGSGLLGSARMLGTGEVVPVPEPTTILAGIGMAGFVGWRERRRFASLFRR
ncbi:MAG: hypothetical protein QOD99_1963 [Chthoniobacter sp.]|jgi:hypothetical protein|nr:hypothetical protein [Chthoniobacter sp.]